MALSVELIVSIRRVVTQLSDTVGHSLRIALGADNARALGCDCDAFGLAEHLARNVAKVHARLSCDVDTARLNGHVFHAPATSLAVLGGKNTGNVHVALAVVRQHQGESFSFDAVGHDQAITSIFCSADESWN